MLPIAHGVDIVDISRFGRVMSLSNEAHISRYFTEKEIQDAGAGQARMQRLAGRFATKEAVMKALGVGWGDGVSFVDVETVTNDIGAPSVVLHKKLAEIAAQQGISKWLVSTSHIASLATSSVIGVGTAASQ